MELKENLTELGRGKILHIETTLKNTAVGFCGREGLIYFLKIMLTSLLQDLKPYFILKKYTKQ